MDDQRPILLNLSGQSLGLNGYWRLRELLPTHQFHTIDLAIFVGRKMKDGLEAMMSKAFDDMVTKGLEPSKLQRAYVLLMKELGGLAAFVDTVTFRVASAYWGAVTAEPEGPGIFLKNYDRVLDNQLDEALEFSDVLRRCTGTVAQAVGISTVGGNDGFRTAATCTVPMQVEGHSPSSMNQRMS